MQMVWLDEVYAVVIANCKRNSANAISSSASGVVYAILKYV